MAVSPPSSLHRLSTTAFALLRIGVGAISLFAPPLSARLFGIEMNYHSRILSRLFGVRELVLGVLLWRAHSRVSAAYGGASGGKEEVRMEWCRSDLRRVLLVGVVIDAVDAISSGVSVWEGSMGGKAIWLVGVGAVAALVWGESILQTM